MIACGLGPDMTKDRISPTPTPTPWQGEGAVTEYMSEGDTAYAAGDYEAALMPYKRALEQEQRQQKLEKKAWYGLVEKLAMSYAKTGEVGKGRVVLAYGISKDYRSPIFQYTLARTYGEEGDEMNAISYLRNAYDNQAKMKGGEKLPDPMTVDSFADFADSETFKKAVADMKRGR